MNKPWLLIISLLPLFIAACDQDSNTAASDYQAAENNSAAVSSDTNKLLNLIKGCGKELNPCA